MSAGTWVAVTGTGVVMAESFVEQDIDDLLDDGEHDDLTKAFVATA